MKLLNIKTLAAAIAIGISATSCSGWLDPKPLSDYTGENAFTSYSGLKAGADMLNRDLRYVDYYTPALSNPPAIMTELFFSDIAVNGMTDANDPPQDLNRQITPSTTQTFNSSRHLFYWKSLYKGVKDCNTILDRIDNAHFDKPAQKDEILALVYFHRAYRYYRLVHQFGDVPLVMHEPTGPKYDYFSTKREVTLRQMKSDLESVAASLPVRPAFGDVSQGAAYHLLTKINLALGEFDDAITSASKVIDNPAYALMTNRFGPDTGNPAKNIIWDLHQNDSKAASVNTEVLYMVIDKFESEAKSDNGMEIMRQVVPWFSATNQIRTPDGKPGFIDNNETKNPYLEKFGRGIGTLRSTWYHQALIWNLDNTDLRHDRPSENWIDLEDLVYNNPNLNGTSPHYMKKLKKPKNFQASTGDESIVADSIRDWASWPHYKVKVPEQKTNRWRGGNADWYIFRLAETYLLRAEAYYWKADKAKAATDINAVRTRANARPITAAEVNMRMILDERARELFYEEPRKCELTRISYIYAKTGKPADDGTVYKLADFSTKNFWYDHIMSVTDFYNKGITTAKGNKYTMSPYHILWPVAENEILTCSQGHINQNEGYPGSETNIEPQDVPNTP